MSRYFGSREQLFVEVLREADRRAETDLAVVGEPAGREAARRRRRGGRVSLGVVEVSLRSAASVPADASISCMRGFSRHAPGRRVGDCGRRTGA
ncbi:hypothetical protein HCN52_23330 [Streptomyces bohaiensis]|uniref:TetR family transcriptional regulator n=1 Tax=Streptomyces bohaiensis TaxID=1431344 RepID=A0ABX1CIQ9_9ACTN|nr:hypothetical protein [Streptomyces bohaiensis]